VPKSKIFFKKKQLLRIHYIILYLKSWIFMQNLSYAVTNTINHKHTYQMMNVKL